MCRTTAIMLICYIIVFRGIATSIIEGVRIQIFMLTDRKNSRFQKRLKMQNTNIRKWTPQLLIFHAACTYVFLRRIFIHWMIGPFQLSRAGYSPDCIYIRLISTAVIHLQYYTTAFNTCITLLHL